MKKAVLFVVAGAALFAAGYFTRSTTHPAAEPDKKAGPVAAAVAAQSTNTASAATDKTAAAAQNVRKFTPGRPFPKGGAKLWLLSLAGMDFDDESQMPELMDIVQSVITMDEECAKEMADALMEIAQAIENDDPAMAKFPNADDLVQGGLMLAMIRLSQFNPETALEIMKKYPDAGEEMAMMFVFGKLAAQNPQHAEEVALTMPEESRSEALQAVIGSLSNKDPRAALAMAQKHADLAGRSTINNVLENWAKREPQQAMPEAVRLAGESGDARSVRSVFEKWREKDEAAATAWAATHEGPGKTTVQAMLLENKAREDPSSVLEEYKKLQASAKDQSELQGLASTIVDKMAQDDVDATKTWVESLPAGAAKDSAIHQLVEQWVEDDVEEASTWIKELPAGSGRDGAAMQLSDKIVRRDPASALEWARSIQDEHARKERIERVLASWEEQDPDAAKAAKDALPPDLQPSADDVPPPPPDSFRIEDRPQFAP